MNPVSDRTSTRPAGRIERAVVAHEPTLLVAVSSGQGGSYPIAEMRASSDKNSRQLYLPKHVIAREVEKVLDGDTISGPNDEYLRIRLIEPLGSSRKTRTMCTKLNP